MDKMYVEAIIDDRFPETATVEFDGKPPNYPKCKVIQQASGDDTCIILLRPGWRINKKEQIWSDESVIILLINDYEFEGECKRYKCEVLSHFELLTADSYFNRAAESINERIETDGSGLRNFVQELNNMLISEVMSRIKK